MASGTPVAVSRAGSLPEVCGDAALYFEPTSVDEIAEAILAVLERPGQLIERGLARASRFTWDATARAPRRGLPLARAPDPLQIGLHHPRDRARGTGRSAPSPAAP